MCLAFGVERLDDVAAKLEEVLELHAAAGARRQGAQARDAQVDRRLAPKSVSKGAVPGGRAHGRRRRPRRAADHALLAARPGAVHHAARRDHEGPRDRRAERRHVPHAEGRPALDLHALADPQGRPRRPARRARRAHPGRRRARARPGHRLLGERAAAEARRRADGRRLPQGLGRAARHVQDRRPRGAGERRDRARGVGRRERHRAWRGRSATTRATTRRRRSSRSSGSRAITMRRDAIYPSIVVGKPPAEDEWLAKATERIFLPGDPDERPRDRRLRPARPRARSTTA